MTRLPQVSDVLAKPSDAQIACQFPKPILLGAAALHSECNSLSADTGQVRPQLGHNRWEPDVVDIQLLRLGQLVVRVVHFPLLRV